MSTDRSDGDFRTRTEDVGNGTYVVTVIGEVDMLTAPKLDLALGELALDGATSVIVDLDGCGFIDSSGFGVLIKSYRRLHESGKQLSLVSDDASIARVIEILALDSLVPLHRSRAEALAAHDGA